MFGLTLGINNLYTQSNYTFDHGKVSHTKTALQYVVASVSILFPRHESIHDSEKTRPLNLHARNLPDQSIKYSEGEYATLSCNVRIWTCGVIHGCVD